MGRDQQVEVNEERARVPIDDAHTSVATLKKALTSAQFMVDGYEQVNRDPGPWVQWALDLRAAINKRDKHLTPLDRTGILMDALEEFGHDAQRVMVMEEFGEFLATFAQMNRGRFEGTAELCGEIADVQIMLSQVQLMHGVTNAEVTVAIDAKMKRLNDRIKRRRAMRDPLRSAGDTHEQA